MGKGTRKCAVVQGGKSAGATVPPPLVDLADGRIEAHFKVNQLAGRDRPHLHPHFELLYIINGVRGVELDGARYEAGAGDLLVFRPGDPHVEFPGTPTVSYIVFRFRPDELAGPGLEFPRLDGLGPVFPLPRRGEFYQLFLRMLEEQERPGEDSQLLLGSYLVEFIVKLRRAVREAVRTRFGEEGDTIQYRINNAMDLMQRNLAEDIDLKKVAKRVFMSVSHFSHTFKEKVGESPKRYLIRERIEKAKELLTGTDRPATEIAEQLGYESPYFFYRQFKSKTGMTVKEFRDTVLRNS